MLPDFTWKRGNYNCVEHFFAQKEVSQLPTQRLKSPTLHNAIKILTLFHSCVGVHMHMQKWELQVKSWEKLLVEG